MADINGSIPASVNPPKNDIFETAGKALSIQQALNANKLFQQQNAARVGIGEAYAAAIDPNTGEVSMNRLMSAAARDPRIAFMAGDLAQQGLARGKDQQMLTQEEFKTHSAIIGATGAALTGLLASAKPTPGGPGLDKGQVIDAATRLLSDPSIPAEARRSLIGNLTNFVGNLSDDPVKNYQLVQQLHLQRSAAVDAHSAIYGQPQVVNTGGQTQVMAVSPMTGAHPVTTLQNTMDPATGSQPTPVMVRNADGTLSPSTVTRQQFAGMAAGGPVATAAPLTPEGLAPAEAQALVEVFDPATNQMVKVPRAALDAAHVAGGGTTGHGIPAAAPLGRPEAMAVSGSEGAKQGVQLQQQADAAPARRAALLSMRDQPVNITTGPAADKMAHISSLAREFGLPAPIAKEGVKATEEFNKLSTQIVLQQVAQLGGAGTDDKLAAGIKGNPSTYLSNLGNKAVTALMLGNEDAISSKNEAWQKWLAAGKGPDTYGQFSTQFNRIYDPRVFQAKYMDPKDRAAMIKNMSPGEKKRYDDNVRVAVQAGWIVP